MGAGPAHRHGSVFGRPATLQGEVFDGRDIVEMPLQQRHVGGRGDQGMMVSAIGHGEGDLRHCRIYAFRKETLHQGRAGKTCSKGGREFDATLRENLKPWRGCVQGELLRASVEVPVWGLGVLFIVS